MMPRMPAFPSPYTPMVIAAIPSGGDKSGAGIKGVRPLFSARRAGQGGTAEERSVLLLGSGTGHLDQGAPWLRDLTRL